MLLARFAVVDYGLRRQPHQDLRRVGACRGRRGLAVGCGGGVGMCRSMRSNDEIGVAVALLGMVWVLVRCPYMGFIGHRNMGQVAFVYL